MYAQNRTGANREVKKAVEAYWAGSLSSDELTKAAAKVKSGNWTEIKARNVDFVPRLAPQSVFSVLVQY